jgi:hypothetical protein
MKTSPGLRSWRKRQTKGSIMKSSTFKSIEHKAASSGATNPRKVAGAAYWRTARAKYRGSSRRTR